MDRALEGMSKIAFAFFSKAIGDNEAVAKSTIFMLDLLEQMPGATSLLKSLVVQTIGENCQLSPVEELYRIWIYKGIIRKQSSGSGILIT